MKIKYDGAYPGLCIGKLEVWVDNKYYLFPDFCMMSGGDIFYDDDWNGTVTTGKWTIRCYPENFPEDKEEELLKIINEEIKWGCCGGCI